MTLILGGNCLEGILVCHDQFLGKLFSTNSGNIIKFRQLSNEVYVGLAGAFINGGAEGEFKRIAEALTNTAAGTPNSTIDAYLAQHRKIVFDTIVDYRARGMLDLLDADENTISANQYLFVISDGQKVRLYKNDKCGELELVPVELYGIGHTEIPEIRDALMSIGSTSQMNGQQLLIHFLELFHYTASTTFRIQYNGECSDVKPVLRGFVADLITPQGCNRLFCDQDTVEYRSLKISW